MFYNGTFISFENIAIIFPNKKKIILTAFEIQMLSMLAITCRGMFRIFLFASAMHQQKNCRKPSRNLCRSRRQWLLHTLAFCQGLWFNFCNCWYYLFYLYYIVYLNRRNKRQYFPVLITLFWFFYVSLL